MPALAPGLQGIRYFEGVSCNGHGFGIEDGVTRDLLEMPYGVHVSTHLIVGLGQVEPDPRRGGIPGEGPVQVDNGSLLLFLLQGDISHLPRGIGTVEHEFRCPLKKVDSLLKLNGSERNS